MSSESIEQQVRDGAPPNDGPLGAPPGPSAGTDREAPSGLPGAVEEAPLGTEDADPDGEGESSRGDHAMPGIPTGGEPPSAG
jgi:hypothetical protein